MSTTHFRHRILGMFLTSITSLVVAVACLASLSDAQKAICGVGEFFNGSKCELCSPGTYQNKKNATTCKPCPAGTYNPYHGAQGLDICIDCPAGTFRDKPGATAKKDCKKCPAGQNAPGGSPECASCPAGKVISNCALQPKNDFTYNFRGNCLSCSGGNVDSSCSLVGPMKLKCEECFAGSFNNKRNALECDICPQGSSSQPGASKCTGSRCPAGSQSKFGGGCRKCTAFKYNDRKFDFCVTCPPGFIGNSRRGAVKCVPCPSGTFKGEDDSLCRPCKAGENTFATGATFCVTDRTPCAPNYFRTKTGACLTCTKRQRLDKKKKTCVECPKNTLSEGGLSEKCNRCPMGTDTSEDDVLSRCFCRPGWGFGDGLGINGGTCKKCPPGTESDGRFYCMECFEGTFAPNPGMAECLDCPPGTSQPLRGQTKCIPNPTCPRGLIRSDEGVCVEPATNCPPNHKRLARFEFETPYCKPITCPIGTALIRPYEFDYISEECGVCEQGTRYNPKNKMCEPCANSEISDGGLSQVCKKCPKGMGNSGGKCRCVGASVLVNAKCVKCPSGTFGYNFVGGCEPCPAGTFSGRGYFEGCGNCPAGTFSGPGARSCKPCPKGTVSFGVGDSGCVRPGSLGD